MKLLVEDDIDGLLHRWEYTRRRYAGGDAGYRDQWVCQHCGLEGGSGVHAFARDKCAKAPSARFVYDVDPYPLGNPW